jgi:hypothetical protein
MKRKKKIKESLFQFVQNFHKEAVSHKNLREEMLLKNCSMEKVFREVAYFYFLIFFNQFLVFLSMPINREQRVKIIFFCDIMVHDII